MELKAKKIRQQNRDLALQLMIPTAILAKIIYIFFLPDKYFFDSWRMIDMLINGEKSVSGWESYQSTVDFHEAINIFHFTNINQFSIWYGAVMTIVIMLIVSKTKEMQMQDVLFTLMATGVLNIYVFNLNKEMIQIFYFFALYLIISLPIRNTFIKIVACAAVYYLESINFRAYYILMAAMTILMYCIFIRLRKMKYIGKRQILAVIILCFAGIFVFFYASQYVAYDDYLEALNVRDSSTSTILGTGGASSAIYNPIEVNGNLGIFMFDYVINAVRMMFPIELLFKSPGYAPFVVYQIFILIYVFQTIKNIQSSDKKLLVALSCFAAYFFGSVVFEPDFGSWVRHEATTFPILQLMAYKSNQHSEDSAEVMKSYETANI